MGNFGIPDDDSEWFQELLANEDGGDLVESKVYDVLVIEVEILEQGYD